MPAKGFTNFTVRTPTAEKLTRLVELGFADSISELTEIFASALDSPQTIALLQELAEAEADFHRQQKER